MSISISLHVLLLLLPALKLSSGNTSLQSLLLDLLSQEFESLVLLFLLQELCNEQIVIILLRQILDLELRVLLHKYSVLIVNLLSDLCHGFEVLIQLLLFGLEVIVRLLLLAQVVLCLVLYVLDLLVQLTLCDDSLLKQRSLCLLVRSLDLNLQIFEILVNLFHKNLVVDVQLLIFAFETFLLFEHFQPFRRRWINPLQYQRIIIMLLYLL